MSVPGTCDDCGCADSECECPDKDIQRGTRGARGWPAQQQEYPRHPSIPASARVHVVQGAFHRKDLLEELERVRGYPKAIVLDASPQATKETRDRAKDMMVRQLQDEYRERTKWARVHWAKDMLGRAKVTTDPEALVWRRTAVGRIRALVWLLRLARVS